MRSEGFALDMRRSRMGLNVSVPRLKSLRWTYLMDEERLNKLMTLGFRMTTDESKLTLSLSGEKTDVIAALKILLVRIAFEIFCFGEFGGESFIETSG